jgi:hypothetical protein
MNIAKRLAAACFILAICLGSASAQQFIIKKKKVAVMVEQDSGCPQGISISAGALAGHRLCTDYPEGIADQLRKFVGSTVELEGLWTFLPGNSSNAPVALGMVSRIGSQRIAAGDAPDSVVSAPPPSESRLSAGASVKGVTPNEP